MGEAAKVFGAIVRLMEGVSYPVPDDSMFVEVWTSSVSSHVRKVTPEEVAMAKLEHENDICAVCGCILGCL